MGKRANIARSRHATEALVRYNQREVVLEQPYSDPELANLQGLLRDAASPESQRVLLEQMALVEKRNQRRATNKQLRDELASDYDPTAVFVVFLVLASTALLLAVMVPNTATTLIAVAVLMGLAWSWSKFRAQTKPQPAQRAK